MQSELSIINGKTVFDIIRGMGIFDLAVGKWVYEQAVAAGQELRLSNFFYEVVR